MANIGLLNVDAVSHLIKLLQLGEIEKGSASMAGTFKSLISRSFGDKKEEKKDVETKALTISLNKTH